MVYLHCSDLKNRELMIKIKPFIKKILNTKYNPNKQTI